MIRPPYLSEPAIHKFIEAALTEDIGEGDHTTVGSISATRIEAAHLLVKQDGVIAGLELAQRIFNQYDQNLQIQFFKKDGDPINIGDIAFVVKGSARSILSTERLVLNCLQRMSGIATYTHHLREIIKGTRAQLMDTRKTTPNFRLPEKWAVAIGGAKNHRYALYDMIMLKDNHVDAAGGIEAAIKNVKAYLKDSNKNLAIEIETRNLAEVEEVLRVGGVEIIMLDNMSPAEMKEALKKIKGRYKTEASGGITEATLRTVAECGVDYISIGALTHSVKSLDLSLKVIKS